MDLDVWLAKIRQTRSHAEVFAILDEFRKQKWDDDQCSKMARLYMRMLDNFGPVRNHEEAVTEEKSSSSDKKKDGKDAKESKESKVARESQAKEAVAAGVAAGGAPAPGGADEIKPVTTGTTPVNDGPVWYEKM